MFIETNLCGPLRIASNGVDSVVIGGNEKSLIIDASTSFRGEQKNFFPPLFSLIVPPLIHKSRWHYFIMIIFRQ